MRNSLFTLVWPSSTVYRFFLSGLLLTVLGCAKQPAVMIEDRLIVSKTGAPVTRNGVRATQQIEALKQPVSDQHILQSGDTLYSVAFAHRLTVEDLMRWNNITDYRNLQIGQVIVLTGPAQGANPIANSGVSKSKSNQAGSQPSKPPAAPSQTQKVTGEPEAVAQKASSSEPPKERLKRPLEVSAKIDWRWPITGEVIEAFSTNERKQGIVIASPSASAVKAAAAGQIVYAGNALKGYGNLVIVNHVNGYLSAYAHTQEILVAEGQQVAQQDVIARVGRDKQGREGLHFQIRQNGNPLNPLLFLPKQ